MMADTQASQWVSRYATALILVVPLLLIALAVDLFSGVLLQRIAAVFFINLTLVLGLQLFNGNSGVLSFGHIGFMGIGAYASILLSMTPQAKAIALPNLYPFLANIQLPFFPALLVAALFTTLVAALISFPLVRLSGPAAVIATFALLVIIHRVLINWDEVTNGARTIFGIQRFTTLWMAAAWGSLFVAVAYWFKETPLGLKLRASREDEQAARSLGINIVIVRWVAFIISAFMVAVAGGLYAHFIISFSPLAFYLTQTFLAITMLIVGGAGSVSGAVVGTLVVTVILEGLRGIENTINFSGILPFTVSGLPGVLLAVALILILILRPGGVTGGQELHLPGSRARSAVAGPETERQQV